ncbi:MAG: hypothetical protein R2828_34850 [Saprospiraceae bacterium]
MNKLSLFLCLLACFLASCKKDIPTDFHHLLKDSPAIQGKPAYLTSPFITAGNRVYMVGHQDGSFPEIGWHIKGEMGGIWNHPIKLMDGFEVLLTNEAEEIRLDQAHTFTNYPFANRHDYKIDAWNLEIERWQFVPDDKEGLAIQLVLHNKSDQAQNIKIQFVGHADLRPTWLGERTQMVDGVDEALYKEDLDLWIAKDSLNPWYVVFGANEQSISSEQLVNKYAGNGTSAALTYEVILPAQGRKDLHFAIAGSYHSAEAALETYLDIQANLEKDVIEKKARYNQLASKSKLTVPDKDIEQAFEWLKYNSDWLIRTVPEIGTGITAGIPDYPWWFGCDSEYALKGYMAIGQTAAVYNTIALLDSISNQVNGNGRIVHEVSTNGAVFNPGNINEIPQFASLIWEIYRWNGDQQFLKRYFPTIRKGLQWLLSERDDNQNLFPDGFGMMEIHGLDSEMIDVAAYTQRAFADAAHIATALGDKELADEYGKLAIQLADKINQEFWSDAFESYADFIGTDQQAIQLIEDAIVRADTLDKPWAVAELKNTKNAILQNPSTGSRPFVVYHNWVVNTPMEMKIATKDKALKALDQAEKFVNPFGVFVTGIDRDASAGSDDGSFKGSKTFSYTGAVMTLPTGVQIVAENNYGRPDQALNYMKRLTRTFSYAFPGSIYEVSPDYGMITQAWNIYAYAVPIVQQFFGIQPEAAKKKIVVQPQMPTAWSLASLENVMVGDNELSIFYEKTDGKLKLKVEQTNPEWQLEVILPKGDFEQTEAGIDVLALGESISFSTKLQKIELVLDYNK